MSSYFNNINSNAVRLTGLSSGFDTESIVKSLLAIDQYKVDKQFKVKTKLTWKGDAYREVNLKLRNFRETFMSATSKDNIFSSKAFSDFKATMHTDTRAVSVTAGSNSHAGTYKINSVTSLAEAARLTSANPFADGASPTINETLGNLNLSAPIVFDDNGQVSFTLNGHDFSFSRGDTLSKVISTIEASGAGVRMYYSEIENGFVINSTSSGEESEIKIENDGGFFAALGFGQLTAQGKDATITINGREHSFANNTFTIDGMTITVKELFNTDGSQDDTPITFSVERDFDATIERVKKFVESYNEMVDFLNGKLKEKIERAYDPLTDEERSQLTETEATKWEELAKSGLLKNDSYVSALLSAMRGAFYTKVEGAGISVADIGLTTTADYTNGGRIELDESKLRAALEANPEQVARAFTGVSESTDSATKNAESGLITRISDAMLSFTTSVTDIALASNTRLLKDADDRLTQLQNWIARNEERYWAKYTAMETALSKLQSQSDWLSGMISSMSAQ